MKAMKQLSALLLIAALILALTACGSKAAEPAQTVIGSEPAAEETAAPAGTAEPEAEAPAAEPEAETEAAPAETPEPTPEVDPLYEALRAEVESFDAKVELPAEEELSDESGVIVKYVQGSYGQGIFLTYSPAGEKQSTLRDGTEVAVLAARGDSSFVRVADGRYGWAMSALLEDQFDEKLSFERQKTYILSDSKYWSSPAWTDLILQHAEEFPDEVVEAAKAAQNG